MCSQASGVAHHASVYDEGAARHVGGLFGSQVHGQGRHLLRLPHPLEGYLREELLHLVRVVLEGGVHRGVYGARGDIVDGDVVRGHLDGDGAHQHS